MQEIKYIFIQHKEVNYENIEKMLTEIFYKIDRNFIIFENNENKVEYFITTGKEKDITYLTVRSYDSPSKASEILSETNKIIKEGNHRKGYRITVLYDSVSKYYCDKAYPIFNEFERKLRELIFNVIIRAYGGNWYEDTVPEDIKKKLKANGINQSELQENALYSLSLADISGYLFSEIRLKSLKDLLALDLDNMNKKDIIISIRQCESITLWEHLFLDVDSSENMKKKLDEIRKDRNKIAHSKFFYNSDYKESRRLIKKVTKEIEKALTMIEKDYIDENYNIKLFEGLGIIKDMIKSIAETMLGIQKTFNNTRGVFEAFAESCKLFPSDNIINDEV